MISERFEQRFKKDFFKLAVLTIITTIVWLGMVTYKAFTKSQIRPEVKKLLTPLTSTLDLDTMKMISRREAVPSADWDSLKPAQPAVLLVPPVSSPQGEASQSAEASPSGQQE
ncbi:MAG: hypothetical protein V1810_01220 [Candidatus Beckwithbacteria bacterium]